MALALGTRLGPYEVVGHIGVGGMGEVYRATDTKLKREVALKILPTSLATDPDRLSRFQREAEILASLNHLNIATIFGLEDADGTMALVMELVEGPTLADRIAQGAVPVDEALPVARQIAEALEAAHEHGIIHRDLKPANIKVRSDGTVKVLDFGLAKAMEPASALRASAGQALSQSPTITTPAMTQAGMLLGTAAYMSPEQARGQTVDKRADIWAFGVVLYELVTGRMLFHGTTVQDTLALVLTQEPDLEQVPRRLRRLLAKCLEKDPRRRLRDIADAWDLLDEKEPVGDASTAISSFRARLGWALAAVATAAALISIILYARQEVAPARALLLTLAPPAGATTLDSFAVSPDASSVVMAAVVEGERRLWIRRVDEGGVKPIPFTEDAEYPFWSPDGRYIAFFARGMLKKVAVSGGPAQSLCAVVGIAGGSWSRNDQILFALDRGGKSLIQLVPAAGGQPVAVAAGAGAFPEFLPDGRHFLYVVTGLSPDANGIYIGSLGGEPSARILPDASSAVYTGPPGAAGRGHIVFVRETTLMAQPFDAQRAETMGDARALAGGVRLDAAMGTFKLHAPVSAARNGVLLYKTESPETGNTQLTWRDRRGSIVGVGMSGDVRQPAISPDARSVLFARSVTRRLSLWDPQRGSEQILAGDAWAYGTPVWSPAGGGIAYGAQRNGVYDLYHRPAGWNAPEEVLVRTMNSKAVSQWSHDGRFVVYQEFDAKTKRDIWVIPMTGTRPGTPVPFLQSEFDEFNGQISPDGRWMAYASDESGHLEVYVEAFPGHESRTQVSTAGGTQPRWRGDGQELFFVGLDGRMMTVTVKPVRDPGPSHKVGAPQPLFQTNLTTPSIRFDWDLTADGQRFLINASLADVAAPLTVWVNWESALPK